MKQPPLLAHCLRALFSTACISLIFSASQILAQDTHQKSKDSKDATKAAAPVALLLTRTTTKHETRSFGYGSTLTVIGAPAGSITIEAWPKSELDVTANIELQAATEDDLALLATVNTFRFDDTPNHISVLSTGTHDKAFMKRAAKNFPKRLLGLPWKIDYVIRLPINTDVEVNAGRGPLKLAGVEGAVSIKALESDATLVLTGGAISTTIGQGTVNVVLAARSWRGAFANIQLAKGDLNVTLPMGFNADINADILRTGQIENAYAGALVPRERNLAFTPRSMKARAGAGGATLAFTVGDGTLRLKNSDR